MLNLLFTRVGSKSGPWSDYQVYFKGPQELIRAFPDAMIRTLSSCTQILTGVTTEPGSFISSLEIQDVINHEKRNGNFYFPRKLTSYLDFQTYYIELHLALTGIF